MDRLDYRLKTIKFGNTKSVHEMRVDLAAYEYTSNRIGQEIASLDVYGSDGATLVYNIPDIFIPGSMSVSLDNNILLVLVKW